MILQNTILLYLDWARMRGFEIYLNLLTFHIYFLSPILFAQTKLFYLGGRATRIIV
jgi:hypothetical protein